MRSSVFGVALLALVVPAAAHAQATSGMPAGGRIFVSVNGLGQGGDGELIDQTVSWTVYGETASQQALQQVSMSGAVLDFGGGYRTNRFGLGVAFSASKDTNTGVVASSIPHPFLTNRPRTLVTDVDGLEHKERVLHLQAYYYLPIHEKAEIGLFLGPSFFSVDQDYVTGLGSFTESANFETVTVQTGRASASDSQVGYNVGAEATYRFTPMVGVALLLRFTRASPEFDFGGQPTTVNVGDVQFGGGLRLRF